MEPKLTVIKNLNDITEMDRANIENKKLTEIIEFAGLYAMEALKNEVNKLKLEVANRDGQLEAMERSHKRSKETLVGQKQSIEYNVANLNNKVDSLNATVKAKDFIINQHLETIKEKENKLVEQQIKIESRDKEIEILENVVEKITGVKCDTEEILAKMENINVNIDAEALKIDYDVLVDKLNSEGGLMVLSKEEATELVNIVKANKNYLIKCTTGKGLVFDEKDTKEKIEMLIDYISNGERADKDMAAKYGCTTPALASRIKTLQKSWYNVIKEYIVAGNQVTDKMKEQYSEKYAEIIRMISER